MLTVDAHLEADERPQHDNQGDASEDDVDEQGDEPEHEVGDEDFARAHGGPLGDADGLDEGRFVVGQDVDGQGSQGVAKTCGRWVGDVEAVWE